jgi:TPR repeat protein
MLCWGCDRGRAPTRSSEAAGSPTGAAKSGPGALREACPWLPAVAPEVALSPAAQREVTPVRAACEKGEPGACVRLSAFELDGALVPPRPASVWTRLDPLCKADDYRACSELGRAGQRLDQPSDEALLGGMQLDPERYLVPLTKACEHGVLASCRELGSALGAASRPATRAALEKACDQGRQPLLCGALARLLLQGGSEASRQRAQQLAGPHLDALLSQCQAKQLEACRELSSFKYASQWVELGLEERFTALAEGYQAPPGTEPVVFKVLELACAAGERAACIELGASWAVQGQRSKGEPYLVAACDAGDQRGCLELATFWGSGNPKARELLQKACSYGFVAACVNLGRQDPAFRRRACELGSCDADAGFEPELTCVAAQRACDRVIERARQPLTASCRFALLRAACDQGDRPSCGQMGELYRTGSGVAKDPQQAAKALDAACHEPLLPLIEHDGSAWCEKLAGYRERGDGVVKDSVKAAWGYADLCVKGRPGACDAIERVIGRPFARAAYGPDRVGDRRCALLPEGFLCGEQRVCQHRVSVYSPSSGKVELVADCVGAEP